MPRKIIFCFILPLWLIVSSCSRSAAGDDPYNLHFAVRPDFKWKVDFARALTQDSTQPVSGKFPLLFRRSLEEPHWTTSSLWQRIILPHTVHDSIYFTIRNRCGYLTKGMFYVNRWDGQMNLVGSDSLNINADGWNTHSLTLASGATRVLDLTFLVTAIGTGLKEKYQEPGFSQFMALDKMEIKIGKKDVAALGTPSLRELSQPVTLDPKRITALESGSSPIRLPLKNKKIVALGETVHFNDEVSRVVFEVVKERIKNDNCRIVMLEIPYNLGFMLNYYTSGAKLTPAFCQVMAKMKQHSLRSSASQYAFWDWLRQYNQNRERKVLLLGIDMLTNHYFHPELEVLNAAAVSKAEHDSLASILADIANKKYRKVADQIETHRPFLTALLGEENYKLFGYTLERNAQLIDGEYLSSGKYLNGVGLAFLQRDQTQYRIAQKYLTSFLNPDETACIYAHYGHLAKSPVINTWLPCGYFLNREYGGAYCPVAVVVGRGMNTMRSSFDGQIKNFRLAEPPQNSLEYAAGKLSDSCFYYPLTDQNNPFSFIRTTGSLITGNIDSLIGQNQFENVVSPNGQLSGFIYIPEGRPEPPSDTVNFEKQFKEADRYLFYRRLDFIR